MIKERLDAGLDDWIDDTRFGFRANISTSQASYLARRLMDISEQGGKTIALVLLDREKAFDKISQQKMMKILVQISSKSDR